MDRNQEFAIYSILFVCTVFAVAFGTYAFLKPAEQSENNMRLWQECVRLGGKLNVLEPTPLGFYQLQCIESDLNRIIIAEPVKWYK